MTLFDKESFDIIRAPKRALQKQKKTDFALFFCAERWSNIIAITKIVDLLSKMSGLTIWRWKWRKYEMSLIVTPSFPWYSYC
jgi:hypothetical protein